MIEQFIRCIHLYVDYWHSVEASEKDKLNGLAFSILNLLDGTSGTFNGSIEELSNEVEGYMLHDLFYSLRHEKEMSMSLEKAKQDETQKSNSERNS